jgi:predicted transcriptional regulator
MLSGLIVDFLLDVKKKGFVTKKSQKIFSGIGYYLAVWKLRDMGFLYNDGITSGNEKIWKLTEKGKALAELLEKYVSVSKKIEEMMK